MEQKEKKLTQNFAVIEPTDTLEQLRAKAVSVVPTKRQLNWQKLEMTAFLHFGMNTFTDKEWGDGTDAIDTFAPAAYDADQWVRVLSETGFSAAIVTAKHHDGFCLWPSEYTDYSVKNAKWKDGKGDIVRDVSEACKKYGLKFGVYLSPWDRHDARYGDSPQYNDYFVNQLTELLTSYGDVYEVWFDGACAEGANGKKQVYDWQRYFSLIRKLQNSAVISIMGCDVRWVGNEAGKGRKCEWSVIPYGKLLAKDTEEDAFIFAGGDLCLPDLGSDDVLAETAKKGKGYLFWYPAQVDTSIRPGWFYHTWEDVKVKSLDKLIEIYYNSVGSNAQLLLNIPPNTDGLISRYDEARLRELSAYLKEAFQKNLLENATARQFMQGQQHVTELRLPSMCNVNCIMLCEDMMQGQRVAAFSVLAQINGEFVQVADSGTIGYKKILPFETAATDTIRIVATDYRAQPVYSFIGLYDTPGLNIPPVITRNQDGMVAIRGAKGAKICYAVEGEQAERKYDGPFALPEGGMLTAVSTLSGSHLFGSKTAETVQTFGLLKKGWSVFAESGACESGYKLEDLLDDEAPHVVLKGGMPVSIIYDMGKTIQAAGFLYLPVSHIFDFAANLYEYEISFSSDGKEWIQAHKGLFDNLRNNPLQQEVRFTEPVSGRFLKFTALRGFDEIKVAFGKLSVIGRNDEKQTRKGGSKNG